MANFTNISASGFSVLIKASKTFPQGFLCTEFADDADPFDLPSVQVAETAIDINGNMKAFSTPNVNVININVTPNTEEDKNLKILLSANTSKKGRQSAMDEITMIATYPDGSTRTAKVGVIVSGIPANSPSSASRLKSNQYVFNFQEVI